MWHTGRNRVFTAAEATIIIRHLKAKSCAAVGLGLLIEGIEVAADQNEVAILSLPSGLSMPTSAASQAANDLHQAVHLSFGWKSLENLKPQGSKQLEAGCLPHAQAQGTRPEHFWLRLLHCNLRLPGSQHHRVCGTPIKPCEVLDLKLRTLVLMHRALVGYRYKVSLRTQATRNDIVALIYGNLHISSLDPKPWRATGGSW